MLQLHLSDRQFNCLLRCVLYYRFDGIISVYISCGMYCIFTPKTESRHDADMWLLAAQLFVISTTCSATSPVKVNVLKTLDSECLLSRYIIATVDIFAHITLDGYYMWQDKSGNQSPMNIRFMSVLSLLFHTYIPHLYLDRKDKSDSFFLVSCLHIKQHALVGGHYHESHFQTGLINETQFVGIKKPTTFI